MTDETKRHYARRDNQGGGTIEIVDREFDFVRAVLPYDYRFTCNAQQWDEAERICTALEGPMISLGVVSVGEKLDGGKDG
jgi:hypothetical protein